MTGKRTQIRGALLLAILSAGCGRSEMRGSPQGPCVYDTDCAAGYRCIDSMCVYLADAAVPDALVLKEFGEPCEEHFECRSTYCLPNPQGSFCTRRCEEGCPAGWECVQVPDPHGGSGYVGLCAVVQNRICQPCTDDLSCNVTGSDLCLPIGQGRFCAIDCTFRSCPAAYSCRDVATENGTVRQCLPDSNTCLCNEETEGMVRGCQRANTYGTCNGFEVCEATVQGYAWSACSALEPAPESCNGLDDDCNGFIDEDLVGGACQVANEHGTCDGQQVCNGSAGWVCDAPVPVPEECDALDNDCDGFTDEGFVDGQGRYILNEHCGSCGTDCGVMIPHATATRCDIVEGVPACRATACESGYFPYLDGAICLQLPANLCAVCGTDDDCLAPGSRCMQVGTEQFCGRDCSPQSPYGAGCPSGYVCQPYGPVLQCQPVTGTCQCRADTLGAVRSCVVDTCTGYQTCTQQGANYAWTPCNVEDYNVEICDMLDNNCNGQIDEGFLNAQTGRYEATEHCGFCNNDCSKYWSPQIDHVLGVCDLTPAMPECVMGPCLTEVEQGVWYEWVDVNGDPNDGCECRRVLGNTDQDDPDLLEYPDAGHPYLDENCDGIDGVIGDALFVWAANPNPGNGNGTLANPYKTIGAAVSAFGASGKQYILVAEGVYQENVRLVPGVKLHGGYSADFTHRDVSSYSTIIRGQAPTATAVAAIHAENISSGSQTLLSGFVIQGRDITQSPADDQPGQVTYAVYLKDCNSTVVLRSNWIVGGTGGKGGRGSTGTAGHGRQISTAVDGQNGTNAQRYTGSCGNLYVDGGQGGNNSVCTAVSAADGGWVVCPVFDWNVTPYQGARAAYSSNAGGNGLGGYDWSFDDMSGSSCSHATESGYPSNMQSRIGQDGFPGQDGTHGTGGAGCNGRYGSVAVGLWVASPFSAASGSTGVNGQPGGGGGAGGGVAYYRPSQWDCPEFESGPSGGGGGAGGCCGQGGLDGRTGGGAIGIFIYHTASGVLNSPQVLYNRIQRGLGGKGGAGGFGGMGGLGGRGGFGGGTAPTSWISAQAGKGGDGGNGGSGGGGGGGCGGASYGILGFNLSVGGLGSFNEFVLADTVATGGQPGSGGGGVGPSGTGAAGQTGASRNLLSLSPCGSGGSCPSGRTCDGNNVCVPVL